jgi:GntR family transcriptional regulator
VSVKGTPRYEAIATHLRELVAQGRPGERLPSDAELCRRFSVSRMTARHAVERLEREGLLYRRRGQGTFVSARPVLRVLGSPLSFTESMRRRGLRATSQLLFSGEVEPSADDVVALRLKTGQPAWVIERLRLADDTPMAIERVVLPPDLFDVAGDDLERASLHEAFERRGRVPTRAQAWVSASVAGARERRLLDLRHPAALIVERRVISDQDELPLEHTETLYTAERYRFETVLLRDAIEMLL